MQFLQITGLVGGKNKQQAFLPAVWSPAAILAASLSTELCTSVSPATFTHPVLWPYRRQDRAMSGLPPSVLLTQSDAGRRQPDRHTGSTVQYTFTAFSRRNWRLGQACTTHVVLTFGKFTTDLQNSDLAEGRHV